MRRFNLCFMTVVCCVLTASLGWALELTFVHTSDVHGHYESFDANYQFTEAAENWAGSARQRAFFQQIRSLYPHVVIADTGDQSDKSPYVDLFGAELVNANLQALGYDLWTLGNHELSYGIAGLEQFTAQETPVLICANISFKNDAGLAQKIKPWLIKNFDGRKVGFIGVITDGYHRDTDDWELTEPKAAVLKAAAELKAHDVDIIVLLSHCGYDLDLEMAREIEGLDVILGGHFHLLFSNTAADANESQYPMVIDNGRQKVLISNVGQYGKYAGLLRVTFDDAGLPAVWRGDSVLMDDSILADAGVAEFLQPYKIELDAELNSIIAETLVPLNGNLEAVLQGASSTANLIGDAYLAAGKPLGAQIAMYTSVSVGPDYVPAGPLSLGKAKNLLKVSYRMFTVDVKGDILRQTLEASLTYLTDINKDSGRFLQFAGLRYIADLSRPEGEKVVTVEVLINDVYQPLQPDAVYKVITYGNILGRDVYPVLQQNHDNRTPLNKTAEAVFLEYIKQNSPLKPLLDGRAVLIISQRG